MPHKHHRILGPPGSDASEKHRKNMRRSETSSRLAYSIKRLAKDLDVSSKTLYAEIWAGRLIASKIGRRTIITGANARRWLKSLPTLLADWQRADFDISGGPAFTRGATEVKTATGVKLSGRLAQ